MRRRSVVAAICVGALVIGGVGMGVAVTSKETPSTSPRADVPSETVLSSEQMTAQLNRLEALLTCSSINRVDADSSFFDPAVGIDCFHPNAEVSFIRVYWHGSTVGRVLQEWAPTFGAGRLWSTGANWVFMGTPADARLLERARLGSVPTKRAPPPVGTSPLDAARDLCMSFLFATAFDRVRGKGSYDDTIRELEAQYPGARRAVEGTVSPDIVSDLGPASNELIMVELTRFGGAYRDVCRSVQP